MERFICAINSAEGAAFSSRGRKAVVQDLKPRRGPEARRAGTLGPMMRFSVAPSALAHLFSSIHGLTAVAITDGPSDLKPWSLFFVT